MSDDAPSPIRGISEENFNLWKHHPVSELFRRFSEDFRAQLIKEHLSDWHAGKIDQVRDLEIRGRVAQLTDIIELSFASIQNFYPEQEGNDGSENDQVNKRG